MKWFSVEQSLIDCGSPKLESAQGIYSPVRL